MSKLALDLSKLTVDEQLDGSRLRLLAAITDKATARKILEHLGLPAHVGTARAVRTRAPPRSGRTRPPRHRRDG